MAPQWNRFSKRFHFVEVEAFFPCKVVVKRYLNGGHHVDMKTAVSAPLLSFSVQQ